MTKTAIKAKTVFEDAFKIFLEKEGENILNDVAERNLCARLSFYIETILSKNGLDNYFSDPEYNRKQNGKVKTILDSEMHVIPIQCDIVVHTRGKEVQYDNLIAIEMKKAHRPRLEKTNDQNRLRALTKDSYDGVWSADGETHPEHVCGYALGVYIEINLNQKTSLLEYYQKGEKVSENSCSF